MIGVGRSELLVLDEGIVVIVAVGGEGGVRVKLADGLQVDFRFVEAAAFGAAQMYFTGSKAHNIELRQRAMKRKWKLSEYGLFDQNEKRLAGKTEAAVYKKLGLPWIAPELREADGEIAAAETGELPTLIELDDLRGDLHAHTTASDGRNTIEEMAGRPVYLGLGCRPDRTLKVKPQNLLLNLPLRPST